jgi:AcrR family transcriptional regulator
MSTAQLLGDMPPIEPKRRNTPKTKARIVAAAIEIFAERGYSQAGIRDIARKADVASSLVFQHFGSKLGLFEASLIAAVTDSNVLEGDRATAGARLANLTLANADISLTAMMVLSIGDPEAAAVTAKVTKGYIVDQLAAWLGPPNAEIRALNLLMLTTGFVVYIRRIPVAPVQQATVDWLTQSVQAIIDQR